MVMIPAYEGANKEQLLADAGSGGLPLIPEGIYTMVFVKNEMKPTQKGGQYLELTGVITDGQYANTEFKERLNVVNTNDTARKIAYQTLAKIADAVGLNDMPNDTQLLMNKKFSVAIKTEAGTEFQDRQTGEVRQGKDRSAIDSRTYKALPKVNPSAPAASSNKPAGMDW